MKKVLKIALSFIIFFILILPSWLLVKEYYNYFVTNTMFSLAAKYYDLNVIESTIKDNEVVFHIKNAIPLKDIYGKSHDFELDVTIDMEAVTFNIPLTLALLLALVASAKLSLKERWDIVYTGILLLFLLHMVSMLLFSACVMQNTSNINPYLHFYFSRHLLFGESVCVFKDFLVNYAARFEPFLIGLYAWWRLKD